MVSIIILLSINILLHYFQNQILWVFFWKLSTFFGCWENERKFEENQMKCEKGTNLFVWFKTQVFALSSFCKGGFWLRFLRKKAHTHTHTHTYINIHIHTHKHTHTHTHTHTFLVLALDPKMSKVAPISTFKNKSVFLFYFWVVVKESQNWGI